LSLVVFVGIWGLHRCDDALIDQNSLVTMDPYEPDICKTSNQDVGKKRKKAICRKKLNLSISFYIKGEYM
jgi:hypothetical protein